MPKLIHGDPPTFLNTGMVLLLVFTMYINWDGLHAIFQELGGVMAQKDVAHFQQ